VQLLQDWVLMFKNAEHKTYYMTRKDWEQLKRQASENAYT